MSSISRRSLARGAAWAAPVVLASSALPAYAASRPCTSADRGTMNLQTQAGSAGGVSVTYAAQAVGLRIDDRWNFSAIDPAGPGAGWLEITNWPTETTATNPAVYQDATLTFSAPVYNLKFTISDIDRTYFRAPGGYEDYVAISSVNGTSPASGVVTSTTGALVTGAGSLTNPWYSTNPISEQSNLRPTDARTHAYVSVAGPVNSVTIRYWSTRSNQNGNTQAVWVGDMSYTSTDCIL